MSRISLTVAEESDGVRLDRFLVSVLADQSRSQLQRLIKEAHVLVDGRAAKPNLPVKAGQTVAIDIPEIGSGRALAEEEWVPIIHKGFKPHRDV